MPKSPPSKAALIFRRTGPGCLEITFSKKTDTCGLEGSLKLSPVALEMNMKDGVADGARVFSMHKQPPSLKQLCTRDNTSNLNMDSKT